jgi:hypothetical protein
VTTSEPANDHLQFYIALNIINVDDEPDCGNFKHLEDAAKHHER